MWKPIVLGLALVGPVLAAWNGSFKFSFNGQLTELDSSVSRGRVYLKDQVSLVPGNFSNAERETTRRIIAQVYQVKRLAPGDIRRVDLCLPVSPTTGTVAITSLDIWLASDTRTPSFHGGANCGNVTLTMLDATHGDGTWSATVQNNQGESWPVSGGSFHLESN